MHIGGNKRDFYHAWLYRQPDAFITPVSWLADRVLEKTTVPREKLHILPRGIEIEPFTERKPDRLTARRKYGLPPDALVFGLVGRLDPKKGQDIVIEALSVVHAAGHRPHLLLVGDQSFAEGDRFAAVIHRRVEELNLAKFVHFHPHETEIEYAYAALDIFVMASKSECYGMVTVEALVSGVPVIGTNDGGTVSLIDPGRNGLLVEPGHVDDLARAMIRLIDDSDLRTEMGRQAASEAARFSHVAQCEAWEKLFDRMETERG
jgi:glycosyltransferase involved in cell wall biosynthesis